ncbi:T9SS type A sorting domain-containing protein, partial [bacterium]|nr:T9SS type A sorting domain-containing protein [bacterium]
ITVNGKAFTRVSSLTGRTLLDSVYTIVYTGAPNVGGVVALPTGWSLDPFDSVRVEYGYATPSGTAGLGDIDYKLYQTTPTDIPLQLHDATSATDPVMSDLTSLCLNASVRVGKAMDLYLVNGLPGGLGTLASYDLTTVGTGGVFGHIDTYPGLLGRPYDVEIVDRGANTPIGTLTPGLPQNVANGRLTPAPSITNQNTFLGHNYRITYVFDTTSAMNQTADAQNNESDLFFDRVTGRTHMLFCRDGVGTGTAYSYSDDYGQTWSAALTISPTTFTGAIDRPRIVVTAGGDLHVVYEAIDGLGDRHLYHRWSQDGISWQATTTLTSDITPTTIAANRYATLLVDPVTDNIHVIWAGDGSVYHKTRTPGASGSWGSSTVAATGTAAFSAPHAVINSSGIIHMVFVSNGAAPWQLSYRVFNGADWGSYNASGGFIPASTDVVTNAAGFANIAGCTRGEAYPFPQIVLTGDSVWVFWAGAGTEVYLGACELRYRRISALDGEFSAGAGTAITNAETCAPMRFTVSVDAQRNIHIIYPYTLIADAEGLRYKYWTNSTNTWTPAATTTGRMILDGGATSATWAYEPRLVTPTIAGQVAPMLACTKVYPNDAHTEWVDDSPRALFKIIDGVLSITNQTTLSIFNNWRVWRSGEADNTAIPGVSFTITNTDLTISNTDDVDATEFNVIDPALAGSNDYFELTGTPPAKNDLLFLTDSDNHRVKIIRAYDNIDDCFGGATRWDVPGQSNGMPGQTYKLATVGGESSFRVWASPDSTAWTIVQNVMIAGPGDRVCEVNRFTKEIRFGDGVHGAIPPLNTFIRVRYDESVDEAEFGRMGSGAGQMNFPRGLAARWNSGLGHYDVYTCDYGNNRLQKWAYNPSSTVNPDDRTSAVVAWNVASADTNFLDNPEDIEVITYNSQVYLVVSDNDNDRILIYRDTEATGSGGNTRPTFVAAVGGSGTSLNQFMDPRGIAVMAEDSGLVILACDADRDQVVKISQRDWLTTADDDTTGGPGSQTNVLTVALTDARDGDEYLALQAGAVRTIELRVSRTDSLTALRAVATFPTSMIDILSINEGNLWSGEPYTQKIFLTDYDNATGRFEINASMVGDPDGLTSAGSRLVASIVVRADSNLAVPASGIISFSDSTEFRKAGNRRITTYNSNTLNLRGGHLADLATVGGDPGTPPRMIPQPDGAINFADVNVFTQGWNGNGLTFDPIADIGPFLGTAVPSLIANPDGRLDARDLLSLDIMYNWYNQSGPLTAPPLPRGRDGGNLDEGSPIVAAARSTEHGWTIELQVRDIAALTTAHLFVQVESADATISNVRAGEFLGLGSTLFLHTIDGAKADICLGRLNRTSPCASGSGVLAEVDVAMSPGTRPDLRLRYELRDNHNRILGASEVGDVEVQAIPERFSLGEPYPNPFNAVTTFTLNLSEASRASLRVFNVLGQNVTTVLDRDLPAGVHRVLWDARDGNGTALSTGVYFVRLEAAGRADIRKIVLIR